MTRPPQVESHALLKAQKQSLELVVVGAPLESVLRRLVETVEEHAQGAALASIMLLDEEGRLRSAAAPSLPAEYLAAIEGLPADPDVGTCCAAAALGEAVVTPDFETSPGWRGLAHLPLAIGLRSAWSMPILARSGAVLGTFGTYFRECREPTEVEREVVEVLARTAAIAIERDRADEELRRARDQAESASRTKSQFLAVMSHELRTPLAGIIGYAELLTSEVSGPLSDTQRAHAARIKGGAWHLVSIIDEILTFSRLEAGHEKVSLEPVDVARIARESVDLLHPQATAKGISLKLAASGEVVADADPGKLRQIVLNLTGNALKFTDEGGVEVMVGVQDAHVVLRVRDTGPGIPADQLERIFEPFVQLDSPTTRRGGGTGLGLAVSRNLARLLGGELVVEATEPGRGTTFALRLPAPAPGARQPGNGGKPSAAETGAKEDGREGSVRAAGAGRRDTVPAR